MKYSCVMFRQKPGQWVQREVGLRHVEIVLSPVGDRLVADHVEPGDDLVHDPLEEALRRSLDFLKSVELMLEQLDCLLVVLLCDLRRKIVMKPFRVCLDLDVNQDLTLLVYCAHRSNLPLGCEIGGAQVEGSSFQHGP